jgi:hypothetical protein
MRSSRQFVVLGLFILAGFVGYSNILNSYFISDDFSQIGKVLAGDLSVVWGKEHGGFFRPLFILSYLIDSKLWGLNPVGFHLSNIAFHSLNSFLVFALSLRMLENLKLPSVTRQGISLAAGALFLLHPSHTEAVSWISGRVDVLATFFCLAALLSYLGYARSKRASQLACSLLFFILALLAKESAICLPFLVVIVGLSRFEMRKDSKSLWRFVYIIAVYVSILLVFIAVRSRFLGSLVGGYGVSQHLNFAPGWLRDRLLEASVRSVLPILPFQLSRFLFKPLQSRVFILFSLTCAGLIVALVVFRRRWSGRADRRQGNRFLIVLASLFLVSLLPVINLRLSLYETWGERFLYLPSVFACLLIAYLAAILIRRKELWLLITICILGFYSVSLYRTNRTWRQAAELSRSIQNELVHSSTRDHLVILNVPDNLRGTPIFHNGLPEALAYFQHEKHFERIETIAFQDLRSATDGVEITSNTDLLTVRLRSDQNGFSRTASTECLEIANQSPNSVARNSLELRVKSCSNDTDIFFFDQGRMTKLPNQ